MHMQFATCERDTALRFLRRLYPSRTIEDTPECAGPLLDFVERDVVRITDPDYHEPAVIRATHWSDDLHGKVFAACEQLHRHS